MNIAYNIFEQFVVCVTAANDSRLVIQQGNTNHISLLLIPMKLLKSQLLSKKPFVIMIEQ